MTDRQEGVVEGITKAMAVLDAYEARPHITHAELASIYSELNNLIRDVFGEARK